MAEFVNKETLFDPSETFKASQAMPLMRDGFFEPVRQLDGGKPTEDVNIQDNSIAPSAADVRVDTEDDAPADDLQTISLLNTHDGMHIRLMAKDDTRAVTLRHSTDQLYGIRLAGGADKPLSTSSYVELKRDGDYWNEIVSDSVVKQDFPIGHLPGASNFQSLTISNGAISPTAADVVVDTEGAAAADDLTDINIAEAQNGMILRLWAANQARVITVKHSSTLQLAGGVDRVLSQHGYLELKRNGTYWQETPRKDVLELQAAITANNTYSTTEVDTGKKWVDGRKIYRRFYDLGAVPANGTNKLVSTNISNFAGIVSIYAQCRNTTTSNATYYITLPYVSGANVVNLDVTTDGSLIRVYGNGVNSHIAWVVLEYIKTT